MTIVNSQGRPGFDSPRIHQPYGSATVSIHGHGQCETTGGRLPDRATGEQRKQTTGATNVVTMPIREEVPAMDLAFAA